MCHEIPAEIITQQTVFVQRDLQQREAVKYNKQEHTLKSNTKQWDLSITC